MFENLNPLDRTTAILEIVIMLVVAFLIGYFTRWFSAKKTVVVQSSGSSEKELKEYKDKIEKQKLENEELSLELTQLETSCEKLKEELSEHEKLNYELLNFWALN